MANQLILTATRVNTTKILQFQNPVTLTWVDGTLVSGTTDTFRATLTGIASGSYSNLKCRLKGSSPEISAAFVGPVTVSGGSTKASTPTGSFDSATRLYTVNIGSYPLSRLLVSTQYGAFAPATTLQYQVPNSYRAPEYWRFKITAAGSETESDILSSPVFTAPGTALPKRQAGLLGYEQSNGIGFAHQSNALVSQRGAFSLGLIHNYVANALQPYEMGVNDQGIRRTDFPEGTSPIYQDGFGAEAQYFRRVQASGIPQVVIKKSVRRSPLTPDGAGFAKWDAFLYAEYKEEIEQAKALAIAAGYELDIRWITAGIKESEVDNPNFADDMHERLNRFEADGLTTAATKRFIMMGYCSSNYAAIRAMQEQLYQLDPTKYVKIDVGLQPDLGDGVHLNHVGQTAVGNALYDANEGLTITPPATGEVAETGTFNDAQYLTSYGVVSDGNKAWASPEPNPLNTPNLFWLRDKNSLAAGTRGRTSHQFASEVNLLSMTGLTQVEGLIAPEEWPWRFYVFKNNAGEYRLAVYSNADLLTDTIPAVLSRNYGYQIATDGTVTIEENTSSNLWKKVYTFTNKVTARVYSVGSLENNTRKLQTPRTIGFAALPATALPWAASTYTLDSDVTKAGAVYSTTGSGFNNVGRELEYAPANTAFRTRFFYNHYTLVNAASCVNASSNVGFSVGLAWYISNGELAIYVGGNYQSLASAVKVVFGRWYGWSRTTAGVITIEESGDGETWRPIYEFTTPNAGALNLGFDLFDAQAKMRSPEYTMLVPV